MISTIKRRGSFFHRRNYLCKFEFQTKVIICTYWILFACSLKNVSQQLQAIRFLSGSLLTTGIASLYSCYIPTLFKNKCINSPFMACPGMWVYGNGMRLANARVKVQYLLHILLSERMTVIETKRDDKWKGMHSRSREEEWIYFCTRICTS